jgi:hypothetical protein
MKNDPFQDPAKFKVSERDAEVASLKNFQQYLTSVMTQLHAGCVPFNWTEPDQKEKSECVRDDMLGYEGAKKQLDPENNLRGTVLGQMSYDLAGQAEEMAKAAGDKMDASTRAKIAEYESQAEKLRIHSRFEEGKIPPEYQTRIAGREEYAKVVRDLAARGITRPESDPAAVKVLLEINRPEVEALITSIKRDLVSTEKNINDSGNSDSDRKYYEERIRAQKARLRTEEAVLEATTLFNTDAEWDSSVGKAQQINEIKDKLGREFRDADIETQNSNVSMYKKYLEEANLRVADKQVYEAELKTAEEALKKLHSETAAQLRLRGHEYLTKLRYKY